MRNTLAEEICANTLAEEILLSNREEVFIKKNTSYKNTKTTSE